MLETTAFIVVPRKSSVASFTLIELLTVLGIITILASLTLAAAEGVMSKASRSRAATEIQAMSAGLEGYRTDNGNYPQSSGLLTNTYAASDGSGGTYQTSGQAVFLALAGRANFNDTPTADIKVYMTFTQGQVGTPTPPGPTFAQDPWGYSYGYSTGQSASYPYNGCGFFDLWSTGGTLAGTVNTNAWIANWH